MPVDLINRTHQAILLEEVLKRYVEELHPNLELRSERLSKWVAWLLDELELAVADDWSALPFPAASDTATQTCEQTEAPGGNRALGSTRRGRQARVTCEKKARVWGLPASFPLGAQKLESPSIAQRHSTIRR